MEPESFFHVAMKTDDLDEAESFYRDRFGAEVVERGDAAAGSGATAINHVALDVSDSPVYPFDEAPDEAAGLVDSVPAGFLHFGDVVSDVDAGYRAAAAAAVEFVVEPTTFGDLTIAFLTDPSGVRVGLEHL